MIVSIRPTHAGPYPGLPPFTKDQADIFFGRDEQVDCILQKLSDHRFLALVGASGCGKSSLARAGMLVRLEAGSLTQAGAHWRMAVMQPGDRPLTNLAVALLRAAHASDHPGSLADTLPWALATLDIGPLGLVELIRKTRDLEEGAILPPGESLLILIDQFEEIFRYRDEVDPGEAARFVALLLRTVSGAEFPVYVVLTMRSDYLGDCALFPGLPEKISESQYLIPQLTEEQRRDAIECPARVFGGRVEPALVRRLLNDLGPATDQLPLMQHALMRLWDAAPPPTGSGVTVRTVDYEVMGGVANAINYHAEEIFAGLSPEHRRVTEVMFRCLTKRDTGGLDRGSRDGRRPVRVSAVAAVVGGAEAEANVLAVANIFRAPGVNFLIPPADVDLQGDKTLDLSHEAVIRQWERLQEWLTDEVKSADIYRRLEATAQLWHENRADPLGN
jgi:hypothetical protein